ncbi:SDR family oxidoreductase [Zunongwangia sp.]|uniref:SDR family oxidoreductase n=1 Tax=Zunongwangia sp. TaxID=1965325 RepID=UPI003AA8B348
MKKTLITGATGSLGQLVVKNLLQNVETDKIAVLVRNTEKDIVKEYQSKGLDVRVADYNNLEKLQEAFKNIEQVYLISGSDLSARLEQHKNVVEAAKANTVKHIFYTSTVKKTESTDAPLAPVVNSHLKTEQTIIDSGLQYTILRHNLYSDVVPMFIGDKEQLLKTKSIYLPTEDGKVAYVPREDFADAEAKMLISPKEHINKIYEFNGNEKISYQQVSEILTKILGEEIAYVSPSVDEFEAQMKEVGLPTEIVGMLSMFSQGIANNEFDFDTTDLEKILGRKTKTMQQFLTEVYA